MTAEAFLCYGVQLTEEDLGLDRLKEDPATAHLDPSCDLDELLRARLGLENILPGDEATRDEFVREACSGCRFHEIDDFEHTWLIYVPETFQYGSVLTPDMVDVFGLVDATTRRRAAWDEALRTYAQALGVTDPSTGEWYLGAVEG